MTVTATHCASIFPYTDVDACGLNAHPHTTLTATVELHVNRVTMQLKILGLGSANMTGTPGTD